MPDNLSQADVALRQAIYFEYAKENEADNEDKRTKELLLILITLFIDSGIDFTQTVPKVKLTALLSSITDKLGSAVVAHNQKLVKGIFDLFTASIEVTTQNYARVADFAGTLTKTLARFIKDDNRYGLVDKLYSGSTISNNKLWQAYVKEITPGAGVEPLTMIKDLGKSIISQSTRLAKQAYIEKLPISEIVKRIKGDPKQGFKDGLINKIGNQAKTVTRTISSSAGNWVNEQVGKLFYDKYQWVSTIDSVTTTICRSRHLNIYTYGAGPRPPAHYNCRSIIVGISGSVANQTGASFFDWLNSQPESVLSDILTPDEAAAIKSGAAKRGDYTAFRNDKRLTPPQFEGKLDDMQTPTEE